MSHYPSVAAVLVSVTAFLPAPPTAQAASSTTRGFVSVIQVMQMLERAPTDRTAQQVLTAYLAGIGETAGVVARVGNSACKASLSLSAADVRQAIAAAAAKEDSAETAATPLIVGDMLDRAGCRHP